MENNIFALRTTISCPKELDSGTCVSDLARSPMILPAGCDCVIPRPGKRNTQRFTKQNPFFKAIQNQTVRLLD